MTAMTHTCRAEAHRVVVVVVGIREQRHDARGVASLRRVVQGPRAARARARCSHVARARRRCSHVRAAATRAITSRQLQGLRQRCPARRRLRLQRQGRCPAHPQRHQSAHRPSPPCCSTEPSAGLYSPCRLLRLQLPGGAGGGGRWSVSRSLGAVTGGRRLRALSQLTARGIRMTSNARCALAAQCNCGRGRPCFVAALAAAVLVVVRQGLSLVGAVVGILVWHALRCVVLCVVGLLAWCASPGCCTIRVVGLSAWCASPGCCTIRVVGLSAWCACGWVLYHSGWRPHMWGLGCAFAGWRCILGRVLFEQQDLVENFRASVILAWARRCACGRSRSWWAGES